MKFNRFLYFIYFLFFFSIINSRWDVLIRAGKLIWFTFIDFVHSKNKYFNSSLVFICDKKIICSSYFLLYLHFYRFVLINSVIFLIIMFEAELKEAGILKKILDAIKDLLNEAMFDCKFFHYISKDNWLKISLSLFYLITMLYLSAYGNREGNEIKSSDKN